MVIWECPSCSKVLSSKQKLVQHVSNQSLPCFCFKSKLDEYLQTLAPTPEYNKLFQCKWCEKKYTQRSNLYRHQKQCDSREKTDSLPLSSCCGKYWVTKNCGTTTNNSNQSIKKYPRKAIPAAVKRLVWNKYVGEHIGKTKCLCCRVTDISQLSFNCGHVVAEASGGQTVISNLRPICQNCNSSMSTANMMDFIKMYGLHDDTTTKIGCEIEGGLL